MEEAPNLQITELKLKPRLYRLLPNAPVSEASKDAIVQSLRVIPKVSNAAFSKNELDVHLGFNSDWEHVKDRVYEVINRQLDPDYIGSVDELKQRLVTVKGDENKQVRMVIRSVVNPVLKRDGGACEFVGFAEREGKRGLQMRFQGACGSCPSSKQTLKNFIEKVVVELLPQFAFVESVE